MEMLKKLAVPFLVLSLAAFGCSSSSSNPDGGKGGSGGGAGSGGAGGGGAGGHGGAGGAGGGQGGAGGGQGGAGGGQGGAGGHGGAGGAGGAGGTTDGGTGGSTTDGATGGTGGSTDGSTDGVNVAAACTGKTDMNATPFTADQFCAIFEQLCASVPGITITPSNCVATYNGFNSTPEDGGAHGQQGCRSYHLCNAFNVGITPHCYHAEGRSGQDAGANTFCM
jgi:hypothetical protein